MNHANTFVRILSDQRDAPSMSESITRSIISEDLFQEFPRNPKARQLSGIQRCESNGWDGRDLTFSISTHSNIVLRRGSGVKTHL